MAGCFGGSKIDRWMESSLNRHLDANEFGTINITFKLFKGKHLIDTYNEEISEEDGPSYSMKAVLRSMYNNKGLRKYLNTFNRSDRSEWTYCPETGKDIFVGSKQQETILAKWESVPKHFSIVNGTFNMMRMGKYSITCDYPLDN